MSDNLTREDQLRIEALKGATLLAAHYPRWGHPVALADELLDWLKGVE